MLLGAIAHAGVNLADQPLAATAIVPGNLLLALSVEWPTAVSVAYPYTSNPYTPSKTYLGYFDSGKCYQYQYNAATPAASYFAPYGIAASHTCTSSAALPLWSGNWLNWASMQTIDTFRWALTGGYRAVDDTNNTILEKAWATGDGGSSRAPNKTIPSTSGSASDVAGATPFNFSSLSSRIWGLGNRIWVSKSGSIDSGPAIAYTAQNSYASGNTKAKTSDIYELYVRVQVCNTGRGVESNCTQYGSNYKPEGLMQKYSTKLRYSAFGYLNDSNIDRDGGVMRARMKYVGPIQPVPGQANTSNSRAEWDSSTGVFVANPDTSDAAASGVSNSGVINYLNKFGELTHTYKSKDPVSELYYAAIRYYKKQGNVPSYSDMSSASAATQAIWIDGFPVITSWDDPIQYSCQKNFILGIGDVNTHRDANLPGSTIRSNEPAMPPDVAADTSVNVKTATDMVGQLEGLDSSYLGSANPSWCCNQNTYFIAGLAYDSHVKDMRPSEFKDHNTDSGGSKINIQTVSTYWLDVQEAEVYRNNNQYYYATKYGGFRVPNGFVPYSAGNGPSTLTETMWHNNADTIGSNKRPDNYFSAGQADAMVSGLTNAFANIASQLSAATTAFSFTSAQLSSSNNASYAARFNASTWTGDVTASSVSYDSSDHPSFTQKWSAKTVLDSQNSRKIVTCCTSSGAGLPFQASNLSGGGLIGRTNYATFAKVNGIPANSQSAANYVAYLRGDRSQEISNGGVYRTRANLLGDIINSKVNPVGPPLAPFSENYNPGYSTFRSLYKDRQTVVYVGANDGMMHAFNGSLDGAGAGSELFAYVPSFVYGTDAGGPVSGLASLGTGSFSHHYLVDQTPQVFDIDVANSGGSTSSTPNWKSVLIGGLGKGGKGYYAIDVTDPASWSSETALSSKVMWEFTDMDMGYSYGEPNVVKTRKYGWVVIFTSGYNNADGVGYFFIVNPANGALLEKISTGSGSTSSEAGFTYATAYVANYTDGTADAIYAGDLQGNVWRLDLTTATGPYSVPARIARLTDAGGVGQPVTTRPLTEVQPNSQKRYVAVGTGRLLDSSDILNSQTQSFYVIADGTADAFYTASSLPSGVAFPISRSNLVENTDLLTGIGSMPSNPMGWYFDLTGGTGGASERVILQPTANNGLIAFASNLPNGDVCSPSGTNHVFAFNMATGKSMLLSAASTSASTSTSTSTNATTSATVSANTSTGANAMTGTDTSTSSTSKSSNSSTAIQYSTTLSGSATDIGFYNQGGKIKLQVGNDQSQEIRPPGIFDGETALKQLNWREVPTAD